jgi:hypothetical protein
MASFVVPKPFYPAKKGIIPQEIQQNVYNVSSIQVGKYNSAVDATTIIYTVPEGYTLFITSFFLQVQKYTSDAGFSGRGRLYLGSNEVFRVYSPYTEGESQIINQSPSYPFILKEKEIIKVYSESAYGLAIGGFTGFLISNKDIKY